MSYLRDRWDVRRYLGINEVLRKLAIIEERTSHMATQEQVDALGVRIEAAAAGIRADLAAIKAANPAVDLSAVESKVAALEALDAENPEATPVEVLDPSAGQPAPPVTPVDPTTGQPVTPVP